MSFKFPYTNFQELNLDWIIKKVKDLSKQIESDSSIVAEYIDRLLAVEEKADNADATATAADARATGANNTANSALTLATQAKQTADIADLQTTLLDLKIGNLSSLFTTAKDTIVNAINEVWSIFHNATAVTNVTPAGTDPAVTYSNGVFTFDLPEGGDPDAVTHAELDAAVDALEDSIDDLSEELDNKADVIIDTASGDIASFPDGTATPLKSLIVNVEPVQAGTGDPSPSNVRPISGWTGCEVTRTGADLFSKSDATPNKYLDVNGVEQSNSDWYISDYMPLTNALTYMGITVPGQSPYSCWYDANKNFLSSFKQQTGTNTITSPSNAKYARFSINATGDIDSFKAYDGYSVFSVTWEDEAGTVYGGTVDIVSGVLTLTHAKHFITTSDVQQMADYSTAHGWYYNGGLYFNPPMASGTFYSDPKVVASCFKKLNNNYSFGIWVGVSSSRVYYCHITDTIPSITTAAEFCQWCENNSVHFTYPLATPITIQLTPQQINAFKGYNNIWSDAGAVEVTYRADTKGYIDKLIAQVQALALGG